MWCTKSWVQTGQHTCDKSCVHCIPGNYLPMNSCMFCLSHFNSLFCNTVQYTMHASAVKWLGLLRKLEESNVCSPGFHSRPSVSRLWILFTTGPRVIEMGPQCWGNAQLNVCTKFTTFTLLLMLLFALNEKFCINLFYHHVYLFIYLFFCCCSLCFIHFDEFYIVDACCPETCWRLPQPACLCELWIFYTRGGDLPRGENIN